MAFELLPEETLVEIVKYAGTNGATSSWLSLASCNRTLNRIATPMLYEIFTERNLSSVPRLLRTVLNNPRLATYVQRYTGRCVGFDQQSLDRQLHPYECFEDEFLDVSKLCETDFATCRQAMKTMDTGSNVMETWITRIRKGKWHAVTSLLLLHLSNLLDFELVDYQPDLAGDMEYAMGLAAGLQELGISETFALKQLVDISLSPIDMEEPLSVTGIIPFLKLPSVESVAVSGLSKYELNNDYVDLDDFPHFHFKIKDLEINNSFLQPWWLAPFISGFTSLRRFSCNYVPYDPDTEFLPQEIGKAIAHLRPCLEELDVSQAYCNTTGRIGSLAEFEKLRRVEVDQIILLGRTGEENGPMPSLRLCDLLPGSLERLVMNSSGGINLGEHLKGLLEVKDERFPKLRRVVIRELVAPQKP